MKPLCLIVLALGGAMHSPAGELDPKHELMIIAPAGADQLAVTGRKDLMEKATSPASTIKIALAAVGIEEKLIDLDSTFVCSDRSDKPVAMNLKKALDLSSNEFFEQLAEQIGAERLYEYFAAWGYPPLIEKRRPPDYEAFARGRIFSVTPRDQAAFLSQLANQRLERITEPTCKLLQKALAQDGAPGLCGKTGSDREGSWFVGYTSGAAPVIYVLRSDIPNSDGKRLRKILMERLAAHEKPQPQD